jgi:hypothetical protein
MRREAASIAGLSNPQELGGRTDSPKRSAQHFFAAVYLILNFVIEKI